MAAVAIKYFGVPVKAGISVVDVQLAEDAAADLSQQLNAAEAPQEEQTMEQHSGRLRKSAGSGAAEVPLGKRRWDVLVTDCFIDKGITPEGCRSREFLTYMRLLIRPGGTILHHLWHTSPYADRVEGDFQDTLQLYEDVFGANKVSVRAVERPKGAQWDSVISVRA